MTIDTADLQGVVNQCFTWSSDGTLSDAQQQTFFNLGMHLRDDMMTAFAATFSDNDARVTGLNNQLSSVNKDIQAEQDIEKNYVTVINKVVSCLGVLDTILKLVHA